VTTKRILILQGNPDPRGHRYGHALALAYLEGAREAGHAVRSIDVAALEFPLLRTKEQWENENASASIQRAQESISWAEHLLIVYPLWLGSMPAIFKAFLEQTLRPGFAVSKSTGVDMWSKLLVGRTAHVVVTLGMPAPIYRWFFCAHSLKSFERNILRFCGIAPTRRTLIGSVESVKRRVRERWLERMRSLGAEAR
jgi:putative NADPH-quinone reductase